MGPRLFVKPHILLGILCSCIWWGDERNGKALESITKFFVYSQGTALPPAVV